MATILRLDSIVDDHGFGAITINVSCGTYRSFNVAFIDRRSPCGKFHAPASISIQPTANGALRHCCGVSKKFAKRALTASAWLDMLFLSSLQGRRRYDRLLEEERVEDGNASSKYILYYLCNAH